MNRHHQPPEVDLANLLDLHRSHGRMATVTAVQPMWRFGTFEALWAANEAPWIVWNDT